MKSLMRILTLVLVTSLALSACSSRKRFGSAELSSEQVAQMLTDLKSQVSTKGMTVANFDQAYQLSQDPESSLYFANAPGSMGPINTIAPLDYASFADPQMSLGNLTAVNVYFIDKKLSDGSHIGALILDMTASSVHSVKVFMNDGKVISPGSIQDREYFITLKGDTSIINLSSVDIQNGELEPVIQMDVHSIDSQGQTVYVGKLSTLIGYN